MTRKPQTLSDYFTSGGGLGAGRRGSQPPGPHGQVINDNQFRRSRRLFLPVRECLSLPSGGPPAQPGPPVISLMPEVTGNKSKKGREVSIPDGAGRSA